MYREKSGNSNGTPFIINKLYLIAILVQIGAVVQLVQPLYI